MQYSDCIELTDKQAYLMKEQSQTYTLQNSEQNTQRPRRSVARGANAPEALLSLEPQPLNLKP